MLPTSHVPAPSTIGEPPPTLHSGVAVLGVMVTVKAFEVLWKVEE